MANLIGKKILITGGAGFIGSNLCEFFVENNKVICFDNLSTGFEKNIEILKSNPNFTFVNADIRDYETCLEHTKDIDVIFHQAALGSVPRSINDPIKTNENNIDGFLNMLTAAKENKVKRFVYAASSSTYGDHKAMPKVEENIGSPLSPYAVTKLVNELYAKVFSDLYGIETIGLRYFNVFGKRQDPNGGYAAVIPKFVDLLLKKQSPTINGDGEQTRDFTHVNNVILANDLAGSSNSTDALNTVYNVACGGSISLNKLVDVLKENLCSYDESISNIEVNYGPDRLGDVRDSLASIEKGRELLGYSPVMSVDQGIKEAISYYVSIQD